jgi:hypothetical protein
MSTEPGWYPDPNDAGVMRFWSGNDWVGERVWDGAKWVDRGEPDTVSPGLAASTLDATATAPLGLAPPVARTSRLAPQSGSRTSVSTTGWILVGGAVAVVIGSLLPWAQASDAFGITVSASPRGGGPVLLLVLAALGLYAGWPALRGGLSKRRLLGVAVIAGILTIFAITNWSDLGTLQSNDHDIQVNAGSGLYLYTAGVVALWVSVVRTWRPRRRPSARVR